MNKFVLLLSSIISLSAYATGPSVSGGGGLQALNLRIKEMKCSVTDKNSKAPLLIRLLQREDGSGYRISYRELGPTPGSEILIKDQAGCTASGSGGAVMTCLDPSNPFGGSPLFASALSTRQSVTIDPSGILETKTSTVEIEINSAGLKIVASTAVENCQVQE